MFGLRRLIRSSQTIRFILKYSDRVRLITRDRSLEDAASEAVTNYTDEAFKLLPRRYRVLLDLLRDEGHLSAAEHEAYSDTCVGTLLGGDMSQISTDEETGEKSLRRIENKRFPWHDRPELLSTVSPRLTEKIRQLEVDAAQIRRDEAMFSNAFMTVVINKIRNDTRS